MQHDKPRKNPHAFVKESSTDVKQAFQNIKSQQNGRIFGGRPTRSSQEDSQKAELHQNGRKSPTKPGDAFTDDVPSAEPQQDGIITDAGCEHKKPEGPRHVFSLTITIIATEGSI